MKKSVIAALLAALATAALADLNVGVTLSATGRLYENSPARQSTLQMAHPPRRHPIVYAYPALYRPERTVSSGSR